MATALPLYYYVGKGLDRRNIMNEPEPAAAKPKAKRVQKYSPRVETRLNMTDDKRLDEAAKAAGKSRADFARQALLWYLDNQENLTLNSRESEVSQAIKYASDQHAQATRNGVDRICKMLARQGAAIGTLYELSWMALPDDENARQAFEAAANTARQKMRTHVQRDEAELAARTSKVITSP
jgi:hypothetical protein